MLVFFVVIFNHQELYGQHRFVNFNIEEGLSQSTAATILQDRNGYIWVGTQDGLNRFDGYTFKVFRNNPKDSTSLSDNFIRSLKEDSKGNLWVGTNEGGLNLYDSKTESFKHFIHSSSDSKSISQNTVWAITESSNGKLWIGTNKGLDLFDPKTRKFKHYQHDKNDTSTLSGDYVLSLFEDSNGKLWVGTQNDGLNLFNNESQTFSHFTYGKNGNNSRNNNSIYCIYEDSLDNLWLGTEEGLKLFNHKKNAITDSNNYLSNERVRSIMQDSKGNLWIGTFFNGLNQFNYKTNTFINYKHSASDFTSISGNRIVSLLEDNLGNIWIGTYGNGLAFFDYKTLSFEHYKHSEADPNSLSSDFVRSFLEEENGNLWVGTSGGGLNYFNKQTQLTKHYLHIEKDPSSISNNFVRCLLQDNQDNIWVGTNGGGLNIFNKRTQTFQHFDQNLKDSISPLSDIIYSLMNDKKGNIWIGTSLGGLNKYDINTHSFEYFLHSNNDSSSLINNTVWTTLEDSKGNLWVGTWGGLDLYNPKSKTFKHFTNSKENAHSISNNFIKVIYEDSQKRLWIGTTSGLNLFNPQKETFKRYGVKEGLSNEVIYGILEDEDGILWISTNSGINKFNPNTGIFTEFSDEDGLQGNEFNTGAYHKGISGKMYFGGVKGFNVFKSQNIKENTQAPPVVLTNFLLFNTPLAVSEKSVLHHSINEIEELVLHYNDFIFGFEFSALNFRQPKKNRFAYKLEGFDKDWTYTDYKYRRATYTNIPPGNYVFKVIASNDDGYWNKEGASVNVKILPPWWLTWWAKTAFGTIPLFLFAAFYKARVSRLKKQKHLLEEQVKARTVQLSEQKQVLQNQNEELVELHREKDGTMGIVAHDLRAPFNRIKGLTQLITLTSQIEPEQMGYFDKIETSITQGTQLINDLLDVNNFQQDNLKLTIEEINIESLFIELKEFFEQFINKKNQKLIFKSKAKRNFYTDKLMLWRIMENLISNANKFSSKGKSTVISVKQSQENFIFSIKDEGPGFTPEDKSKMFGKFQKLSAIPTDNEPSIGLGLSIVKIIVERLKGSISVTSEINVGSEFTITLPDLKDYK